MKNNDEIIPITSLPGYEGKNIFESYGEDLRVDDFIKYLKGEGHGVYLAFMIISITMIVVSLLCIGYGLTPASGN